MTPANRAFQKDIIARIYASREGFTKAEMDSATDQIAFLICFAIQEKWTQKKTVATCKALLLALRNPEELTKDN